MNGEEAKKIMQSAQDLMQMYKAGFLDGYRKAKRRTKITWAKISFLALEAWKERYNPKVKLNKSKQEVKKNDK